MAAVQQERRPILRIFGVTLSVNPEVSEQTRSLRTTQITFGREEWFKVEHPAYNPRTGLWSFEDRRRD